MTLPINFVSKSPRFGFPFLFSGQAQKEFFINEAHALMDALLHPVVEGTSNAPPPQVNDGDCWIVDTNPTGAWAGQPSKIACYQGGSWLFASPSQGMRVVVRSTGADMRYRNGWSAPAMIAAPVGGGVIDVEARAAMAQVLQALKDHGISR